eukprot:TRINITY_DN9572_c0_g2_i1.p1 TRINITY_DN9572_c0_g2~~TRINITY_DN9572_c0_g2_i1.p1  ORF type:complete len:964 (+),score=140.46 TRINITY_DN9572_c0_g2_i1:81-2972(+)
MRRRVDSGMLALVAFVSLTFRGAVAVDASKFRTCEQGSFCRRYRKYVNQIETSGGKMFAHAIDSASIEVQGHVVKAKLLHVHDGDVKPLLLELKWFLDAAEGRCGIIRLHVTEQSPIYPRFRLRDGDVVVPEIELFPDEVAEVVEGQQSGSSRFASKMPGDCAMTLQHSPFELSFFAGGRLLQRLNSRHLLNFESYRVQGHRHKGDGLVDATDVDDSELWQEKFSTHTDTKPRGPAAVGVDVAFVEAADVMGLAQHAANLGLGSNKMKEPYRFYNLDVFEYILDSPMAIYGAVPLATAVHRWSDGAATASGFFFVNPSEGFVKVDVSSGDAGTFGLGDAGGGSGGVKTWWLFESGVIDAYFLAGPTMHAVLQRYHTLTGMPRMPPISTLGKHQSRWNYVDVEDAVTVNKKFDQHDIPYDVLWLDIEHTDGKKYFTWHPTHFAKPDVLLDALNQTRRKLVTIIDPHIKKESGYAVFSTLEKKDYFTKTSSGKQYDGWCWPGTSYYPDFCNPEVRDQWAKFFSPDFYPHSRDDLYTWNDMNEPSVFNGPEVTMPRDNLHKCHTDGFGVEHRDVHNVYGFYHHGATVQGQLERSPDTRPFALTRSFFAGSHRHGAVWTGDNMAKWEHLAQSVPMLLSLSLCGISFSGADVPGFFFDPEPELFKRWHQLGIWYPFYRGHAHLETKRREPWMFGEEVTNMIREQVTARYQMLPTWYTLFAEWAGAGLPILRPLWFHNMDDKDAFQHQDHTFLVGDGILVRAVTQAKQTNVNVYFPAGNEWYDFWDAKAKAVVGGKSISVSLAAGHVPAYVRKGSILFKKMRRRRSTGAMVADPYTVVVYGPSAKGRLYVDDGHSHSYQKGAFLYEEFDFDGTTLRERLAPTALWGRSKALSIGSPQGLDMPKRHLSIERIVFVGLTVQPSSARTVYADGTASENHEVSAEKLADGSWLGMVKKPVGTVGSQWALELAF